MGKVTFVGAGPGNPELITLQGMERLKQGDVIIYDRLASNQLLSCARPDAVLIYVGKKPGAHSMCQEEINRTIAACAKQYRNVVRLKGGDPFVFGRGGEEIQALLEEGIPFEVVPGITSSIAVPELAGIPVTHRGISRSFHVITGHTGDGDESLPEDMEVIAQLHGTLVFLMGMHNIRRIAQSLLHFGKNPDTPAAVISNGTMPGERTVRGTLSDIADKVAAEGLPAPAVIVIGPTAELDLSSRALNPNCCEAQSNHCVPQSNPDRCAPQSATRAEKNCAAGKTAWFGMIGTKKTCQELTERISGCGRTVQLMNMQIVPTADAGLLADAAAHLREYDWILFTSKQAVDTFFSFLKEKEVDIRQLAACRFGVVGEGTGRELLSHGFHADFLPEIADSVSFASEFVRNYHACNILLPRAKQGKKQMADILRRAGFFVCEIPVYDVVGECQEAFDMAEHIRNFVFFSASGVHAFMRELKERRQMVLPGSRFYCIGPLTEQALRQADMSAEGKLLTAEVHTVEGLANLIIDRCKKDSAERRER